MSKKDRLKVLLEHRTGCKFPMVEDLTDEMSQYFDVIGMTKVITNIFRYFYDPSTRPEDPVGFLKSLVKDRKKDQRELHKAKRRWYRLLWREWEIRDEIKKLRTLLGVLAPDAYTQDGDPKPKQEPATASSEDIDNKMQDPSWTEIHPKLLEQQDCAITEQKIMKQHHEDQNRLLKEQQEAIETMYKSQQNDCMSMLCQFDKEVRDYKIYLAMPPEPSEKKEEAPTGAPSSGAIAGGAGGGEGGGGDAPPARYKLDQQLMQTQLDQMHTIQKKQVRSLQLTHFGELQTQQSLHKHEQINRIQSDGSPHQMSLNTIMQMHKRHEQLLREQQQQLIEIMEEIQEQQEHMLDDSLALLANKKMTTVRELPEQHLKRTQIQVQQLHAKQVEQLLRLQEQETRYLTRLHKNVRKAVVYQIKELQQQLPKHQIHLNLLQQQDVQLQKLTRKNLENEEIIILVHGMIQPYMINRPEIDETQPIPVSEDVMATCDQLHVISEKLTKFHQNSFQQQPLPASAIPKIPEKDLDFRKIQSVIFQQQQRLQQQYRIEITLSSILESLHDLVDIQKQLATDEHNPNPEGILQIAPEVQDILALCSGMCDEHKSLLATIHTLQNEVVTFQESYWEKHQKKDEPIDDQGKALLNGKLAKGNKKELHPLQKLLQQNLEMQVLQRDHHLKLNNALQKWNVHQDKPSMEQEALIKSQYEKQIDRILETMDEIQNSQEEEMGPMDLQQYHINCIQKVETWMTEIKKFYVCLVRQSYDDGCYPLVVQEIENMEPLYQLAHIYQDEQLKTAMTNQEELTKHHNRVVKLMVPKQLALTESQLKKQRKRLLRLNHNLQKFVRSFNEPGKVLKNASIQEYDLEQITKPEIDPELRSHVDELYSNLTLLTTYLREQHNETSEKMQELAEQVLCDHQKLQKIQDDHIKLLNQWETLHIFPDKQIFHLVIDLHKQLNPALRVQQHKLEMLLHRLRRRQDTTCELMDYSELDEDEESDDEDGSESASPEKSEEEIKVVKLKEKRKSRKSIKIDDDVKRESIATAEEDEIEDIPPQEVLLRKRPTVLMENPFKTDEEKETIERRKLIDQLKAEHKHVLQQVQVHNKPDSFRRVQNWTASRRDKVKNHEELELYVDEQRVIIQDECPPKSKEWSKVLEDQKQLLKLHQQTDLVAPDANSHRASVIMEYYRKNLEELTRKASDETKRRSKRLSSLKLSRKSSKASTKGKGKKKKKKGKGKSKTRKTKTTTKTTTTTTKSSRISVKSKKSTKATLKKGGKKKGKKGKGKNK